jgi:hypothetical protein
MMRHMGISDIKSGSEKDMTHKDKWMEKTFQWTDRSQLVSVDDLQGGSSHAMESRPHTDSVNGSSEEEEEDEHGDNVDSE